MSKGTSIYSYRAPSLINPSKAPQGSQMPSLTPEHIQSIFDQLGLGTEAERNRLRALAEPVEIEETLDCPTRLDIESSSPRTESTHAKLAPAS